MLSVLLAMVLHVLMFVNFVVLNRVSLGTKFYFVWVLVIC